MALETFSGLDMTSEVFGRDQSLMQSRVFMRHESFVEVSAIWPCMLSFPGGIFMTSSWHSWQRLR